MSVMCYNDELGSHQDLSPIHDMQRLVLFHVTPDQIVNDTGVQFLPSYFQNNVLYVHKPDHISVKFDYKKNLC